MLSTVVTEAPAANMTPDFEVRLQLDPDKVLHSNHQLMDLVRDNFSVKDTVKMNVQFLDKCSNEIFKAGWNVRLRVVQPKPEIELTYKKRYDIAGGNIEAALAKANQDGFTSKSDKYEAQVEWGYKKQTLSVSRGKKVRYSGDGGTDLPGTAASRDMLVDKAPGKFDNFKGKNWGTKALKEAVIFGPVHATRAIGSWGDHKLYIEVWPIRSADGSGWQYFVEASFKAGRRDEAEAARETLLKELQDKGWFLPEDALKTSIIMERYACP
ncbi:hypothetical protein X797_009818 [Metarhizium robertsii]|uniref:CYTH domain-containing protein n=2 Tax=Metarhizium robertsii TaxID=568076 RepID=E9FDB8_METRA|nr:uncharacterized protein MAA_10267 [Metarhizium robertsii ARSEF 23]EFY94284.1 hypothetical protein MAA_10267 [Metarhizium robertsii ARSEF 23]EXU97053.1 hypothetical protein X797_009818 [Metarhizium robertsii]